MQFIYQVLLGILIYLWVYILWVRRRYYALSYKIPAARGYPLLGIALKFRNIEDILNVFGDLIKKFGNLFFMWLGPLPLVVTNDPQVCQDILKSPFCINKSKVYDVLDISIGPGLFSLRNPEWSRHRKLLNPSFTHGVLLSLLPIFNNGTNELTKIFDGFAKTDTEVDLTQTILEYTIGVSTQTTMGLKMSLERSSESKCVLNYFQELMDLVFDVIFKPLFFLKTQFYHHLGLKTAFHEPSAKIRKYLINLIHEKSTSDLNNTVDRTNKNIFIHRTLELLRNEQFTWDDVVTESTTIIFAAFETTAKTILHTLILLAMHPEYQERAFEEIKSVTPELGISEITYDDIKHMKYLEMILNESMRVMSPVPLIARRATADVKLTNGTIIPSGTQIGLDIFHLHRNEDVWGTKAHLYNPENFLPTNVEKRHLYAFMPFTRGIRSCIGMKYAYMSMTVTLAKLLRNYSFETSSKFEDLDFFVEMTLGIKNKPLLKLTKRTE